MNIRSSFPSILGSRPDSDCAEVSLFGPGIGECVVLHVGDGKWFIVDSCLCPDSKLPVAQIYLESIGVDLASQVTGILVTHWHGDHIQGISRLFEACSNANLYFSLALSNDEALEMVGMFEKNNFSSPDIYVREFAKVLAIFREKRYPASKLTPVSEKYTFFDDRTQNRRLITLSPSRTAVTQAIADIIAQTPAYQGDRVRHVVPNHTNFNAVALHFSFGEFSALLGSDLEDNGNVLTGWSAVLNSQMHKVLSLQNANVYKVSHHGSETGHVDDVWQHLLEQKPLSIATPFVRSGLPKNTDIARIVPLSSEFIVTRDPRSKGKSKLPDTMAEKTMNEVTRRRVILDGKVGHIQVRAKGGQMTVATNGIPVSYY